MNETMSTGKRRAAVPVDSGVASGGRHRLDPTPQPPAAGESGSESRARTRWFRRVRAA